MGGEQHFARELRFDQVWSTLCLSKTSAETPKLLFYWQYLYFLKFEVII
jgi:hypothetical protein